MLIERNTVSVNSSTVKLVDEQDSVPDPHPVNKIAHFVQVGFLLDQNNFRLLNTFSSTT